MKLLAFPMIVMVAALTSCAPVLRYAGEWPVNGGAVYERAEPDFERSSRKLLIRVTDDGAAEIEAGTVGPATFRRYTAVQQRYDTANGPWEPVVERILAQRQSENASVPATGIAVDLTDDAGNQWHTATDANGRARVNLATGKPLGGLLSARAGIGGAEVRSDARIPATLRP
jgi:hypothetical protein